MKIDLDCNINNMETRVDNKCKAFTSLEQSRKLAEILPLESADMCYLPTHIDDEHHFIASLSPYSECTKMTEISIEYCIPCWSLAALLELLPKRLEIVDNVYELSVYLYGLYYWNINNGNLCFEAKDKDNFVDACYEAIVFLYEQKLL